MALINKKQVRLYLKGKGKHVGGGTYDTIERLMTRVLDYCSQATGNKMTVKPCDIPNKVIMDLGRSTRRLGLTERSISGKGKREGAGAESQAT